MGSRTAPINIGTPSRHGSPQSPPQSSNLTAALRTTSGNEARPTPAMDMSGGTFKGFGSGFGGSSPRFGTAAQPISVKASSREKPRRESLAGSMVTGMSWGGTSVGSWIRDDIIMQGTSPFAYQSPSFHSSSYLPKLEANFMKDFSCCGLTLPSLHELLQHYEECHSEQVPSLHKQNSNQGPTPDPKAAHAAVAASNIKMGSENQHKPSQINTSGKGQASNDGSAPPTPRQARPAQSATGVPQNIMRGFAPPPPQPMQPSGQDDDGVGDMEMEADFRAPSNNLQYPVQNQTKITQPSQFGQPSSSRVPPLDLNTLNMGNSRQQQYQGLRNSQPTTPVTAGRNANFYHNNPTVSSVNTPTLSTYGTHPLQQQYWTPNSSAPGTPPGELDPAFVGGMDSINMDNTQFMQNNFGGFPGLNGNDMLDYCINEPAKNLFTLGGGFNPTQQQQQPPQQEAPSSSASQLGDAQYSEDSQVAKTIRKVQRENGVPDPSADGVPKPFHCPVIGCEKAYKNQNGLKYHKSHGHQSQKLLANDNGTFSIVDPETLKVYPGTQGMERHKPYKCDNCGKRYKNLNGLKYHKQHNPTCDSEIRMPTFPPIPSSRSTGVDHSQQEPTDAMDI